MSGIFIGFGRIVNVKYKSGEELGLDSNLLELTVAVETGERKKEGQQYAPSNLYYLSIWDKRGDALAPYVEEGKSVFFKGNLGTPYTYLTKDGEPRCSLKIINVDELKLVSTSYHSEEKQAQTSKEVKSKSSLKKAKAKSNDFDDEDLGDIDFS